MSKELKDAEQAIAKEIEEQGRARGGNESKSLMDDGILMWWSIIVMIYIL